MTRYFFYMVAMCMLINTIMFVPAVLIEYRFKGAMLGMAIAVVSGSLCGFIFTKSLAKFPGQGLPEIFRACLPGAIRVPLLLYLGVMWFIAGGIVLVSFARILQRYMNPDINILILAMFLMLLCSYVASGNSRSILYLAEIVIILHVPLIAFVLLKTLTDKYMDWDAIRAVSRFASSPPNLEAVSSATYVFTGYINFAIFNRVFGGNRKIAGYWLLPFLGIGVLCTTFFIPIGINGTYGVESFIYVWISTADSIRMEFAFVERVIFVFILLYFSITLLFITVTWHVGAELIADLFGKVTGKEAAVHKFRWKTWFIIVFIGSLNLLVLMLNEKQSLQLVKQWFIVRYLSEIALVVLVYWLGRKVSK